MKSQLQAKLTSGGTVAVLYGLILHSQYLRWHRLGREAFMAHEISRFNRLCANPPSLTYSLLVGAFSVGLALLAYESITKAAIRFSGDDEPYGRPY